MECIQLSLFGKTCPEHLVPTGAKISEPCWKNLPALHNQTFQFPDLRVGGADGAKPEQSPETDGLWHGDSLMLNTGEFPNAERESRLSWILEDNVPQKYYLSARACQGILTRASRRGKGLPELLKTALLETITLSESHNQVNANKNTETKCKPIAYSFDSLASNSMKSKNPNSGCRIVDLAKTIDTSIPDPSKNQGGIAIVEPVCYTLKIRSGCEGGGKGALVQTEKSATLSTLQDQTLFQPVVYDARGNGDGKIVPTITGDHENRITDYTAIAIERKTFNEQSFSHYKESDKCSTLKAKAGNIGNGSECLIAEKTIRWFVRRLTPVECERLQGFPDGYTDIGDWTDSKGKKRKYADSPRYKALGNSIALPQWFWLVQRMRPYLKEKPTLGSLFDGLGGFPLVWQRAYGEGTARWASEIEEFPMAVTKRRFGEE